MPRTVLLRHELPDGSWHFDWMLETPSGGGRPPASDDDPEARCLVTFRMQTRPDDPGVAGFQAERIGDHRAVYLTYEGALSDGRGRVARVGVGTYIPRLWESGAIEVDVMFSTCERPIHLRGRRAGGNIWIFSLRDPAESRKMA